MPQTAPVVPLPKRCHKLGCKRHPKQFHQCSICEELRGACGFHNTQVYNGLSAHITVDHPGVRVDQHRRRAGTDRAAT